VARLLPFFSVVVVALLVGSGCDSLERFDTTGKSAFCGSIVGSQFVWTPDTRGGFARSMYVKLTIDASALNTVPGRLSSDDAKDGPCAPSPTFDRAKLVVTPEVVNDPLSSLTFSDGQAQNVLAWVDSTCRGKMLAVLSLYKTNHVELRLLKPGAQGNDPANRDAFALFPLERNDSGCGF
jgi:hypothetical protein